MDKVQFSQKTLELVEAVYNRMLKQHGWDHPLLAEFRDKAAKAGLKIEKKKKGILLPNGNEVNIEEMRND